MPRLAFSANGGTESDPLSFSGRYEEVRIPRCTRLQGFAAELTSWPCHIPECVQKLSPGEKAQRTKEFYRWVNQYPANCAGDPDSTYWKPEHESVERRNAK